MTAGVFRLVLDEPAAVAAFVEHRSGGDFSFCPFAAVGLSRDGRMVGGVVFNLYDPPDISVSVAVDPAGRPGVRRLIAACRRYAFDQLGCRRLSAAVRACNAASLNNALRMGFAVEGVKRRAAPDGGDVMMLGYLKEED